MKNNSVYKDFGKMLSYLRVEHKMTRNEVAEKIGVATNTYGQYERGDRKVPLSHAITLSQLLGFDLNEFIENQKSIEKLSYGVKWDKEFEGITFTPEEIEEIVQFAKFILSKRNDSK